MYNTLHTCILASLNENLDLSSFRHVTSEIRNGSEIQEGMKEASAFVKSR